MLLYIESLFEYYSFVITNSNNIINHTTTVGASENLSNEIIKILGNKDISCIKEIICCRGPGSITGIRSSISLALGLNVLKDKKIYYVDSFDILAKKYNDKDYYYVIKRSHNTWYAIENNTIIIKETSQLSKNNIFIGHKASEIGGINSDISAEDMIGIKKHDMCDFSWIRTYY